MLQHISLQNQINNLKGQINEKETEINEIINYICHLHSKIQQVQHNTRHIVESTKNPSNFSFTKL